MDTSNSLSFKEAAFEILKSEDRPLTAKEIVDFAMQRNILRTEGKTPEATMAAQLYMDIRKPKSKFKKVGAGKFSLKTQTESPSSPLLLMEKQNSIVRKALEKKLLEMDPFQFEILVAELLKKIGYENVDVTKRSGDKGIDVIADLTMNGITNVKTVIQVKKYKKGNNIPGKIVTQLRGSAEVDQRGLIITTSDFTKDAIKESKAEKKMPVSLVNGERLLDLLIKFEIGVKKEIVSVYSLDDEFFDNEEIAGSDSRPSEKNRGLWPMPGGYGSYIETLFRYMEEVSRGNNTRAGLISWFIGSYENVSSEKTANGYVNVSKTMGLSTYEGGKVKLTDAGEEIRLSKDLDRLYEIANENVFGFEEIVEFLESCEDPQTEESILEYLKDNFGVEWTTSIQVTFRMIWLMNFGKVAKTEDGYMISR